MDIKEKVYELRSNGMSFGEIARSLGIGKTTAFSHYKEISASNKTLGNTARNAPERHPNVYSERSERLKPILLKKKLEPTLPSPVVKSTLKEITGDELVKVEFDSLEFTGKFLELIGKPSRIFSGIIWGLPKGGKSNLSVRFADYLQEYFGNVVYIAAEEGVSSSMKEKFQQIQGGGVTIVQCRNREEIRAYLKSRQFAFVFIDSINVAGIDNEYLETLKMENPAKSFLAIVQATKSGNFKGDQGLTHNCDFVIKVVAGVASHHGRFGPASEINIFEGELYAKNLEGIKPKMPEIQSPKTPFETAIAELVSAHADKILVPKLIQLPDVNKLPIPKNHNIPLGQSISSNQIGKKKESKPQFKAAKYTAGVLFLKVLIDYVSRSNQPKGEKNSKS